MHEILQQIHSSVDCPVRNCSIGVTLTCPAYELKEALQFGKLQFERTASHCQERNRDASGCPHFSEEEVTIYYDKEGNPTGYDLPCVDEDTILHFALVAGLVPYGEDMQGVFIGTHDGEQGDDKWSKLSNDFSDLRHKAYQANRHFFPPDRIMVNDKPFEVAAVSICNNLKCVSNTGLINIDPLPLTQR